VQKNKQENMNKRSRDDEIIRDILTLVEETESLNQRDVANELGIALGLANAYIKRCARKGYIKVAQIPRKRFAYYLTPKGFSEKTRLTAEFLTDSFSFFRRARSQYAEIYAGCEFHKWRNLVIAGTSELADIAVLYAGDYNVKIVAVVGDNSNLNRFHGIPVFEDIEKIDKFDALVFAHLNNPQKEYDSLLHNVSPDRILIPPLLEISINETPIQKKRFKNDDQ
tara:strand:- start:43628 stop:44299 length:672 start_codon:yes stop_codon:yes gene_type:complete